MAPTNPRKGMFKQARRALDAFKLDQEERRAGIRLTPGEAAKLLASYADPAHRGAFLARPLDDDDMHVACELAAMHVNHERQHSLIATKELVQLHTERVSQARHTATVKGWMKYNADYAKRMKEELKGQKEEEDARRAAEEERRKRGAAERRRMREAIRRREAEARRREEEARRREEEVRRREEEVRRREEEARRKEEKRRREAEEERRKACQLQEEAKAREAAEARRVEEARRAAARRAQEAAFAAELARREEAARREDMLQRAKEARRLEQARRAAEETRRAEEAARHAAEQARRMEEDRRAAHQRCDGGYRGQDVENEPRPAAGQPQQESRIADQVATVLELYDRKWEALKSPEELPPIAGEQMPWPVFHQVYLPEHITYEAVKEFVLHPLRTNAGGNLRKKVMAELLRWHSDKFDSTALHKIRSEHREVAKECAGLVERWLTRLLTELQG